MTVAIELTEIEKLAPMPQSVTRLARIVGDPTAGAPEVAQVVEFDQALTANVLRLANSAWAASPKRIVRVRDAVLRLGAGRILELAVGQRVIKAMSQACDAYELGERELWRHSVAAALAAERIGRLTNVPVPGTAFTAALLHDIGKLVLNRHINGERLDAIRDLVVEQQITYLEAENRVLGTDHAEVGAVVAQHWGFPDEFARAIRLHHDPDAAPEPILDAVHLCNAVAKLNGIGLGSEQMNLKASSEAACRLGLTTSGLEALCATVCDELAKTEEAWGSTNDGA
jgi:putative nucleotidyltransferase with HDIG domain